MLSRGKFCGNGFGNELRAIVGADEGQRPAQDEHIRRYVDDVDRVQLPLYPNHQRLPGIFVDHVQCSERTAVMRPVMDKVVRPDVIRILQSETDAGAVVEPKTASLRLFVVDFQPFSSL